jgi:hypothetical protein
LLRLLARQLQRALELVEEQEVVQALAVVAAVVKGQHQPMRRLPERELQRQLRHSVRLRLLLREQAVVAGAARARERELERVERRQAVVPAVEMGQANRSGRLRSNGLFTSKAKARTARERPLTTWPMERSRISDSTIVPSPAPGSPVPQKALSKLPGSKGFAHPKPVSGTLFPYFKK